MELLSLNNSKGQFITTEFLVIVFVLIFLIVLATIIWNTVGKTISENSIKNELQTAAIDISDQLLKSHGLPEDWDENATKIFSIGLISRDHILDEDKIKSLLNLSYSQLKASLGIKTHEFYFKVVNLTGDTLQIDNQTIETGLKPNSVANAANSRRIAIFNNQIVYMDVFAWR